MSWTTSTIWQEQKEILDFESAKQRILNVDFKNEEDSVNEYIDFRTELVGPYDGSMEDVTNGEYNSHDSVYRYCRIDFSFVTRPANFNPDTDESTKTKGFVILCSKGTEVFYIINKNSDAKKILRMLLGYTKNGNSQISSATEKLEDDFFIWILSKVFNDESIFDVGKDKKYLKESDTKQLSQNGGEEQDDDTEKLIINDIIGFRGKTSDFINKVSARGDKVMNLISTLSFILEKGTLNQIIIKIETAEHENLELKFNDRSIPSVNFESYSGIFEDIDPYTEIECNVLLFVYFELIPNIHNAYLADKKRKRWTQGAETKFYERVSKEMIKKLIQKGYIKQTTIDGDI